MLALVIAALVAASPTPSIDAANALFASGNFTDAKSAYAALVARGPNDAAAILGLARMALYANDLDAAEKELHAVLALDPNNTAAKKLLDTAEKRRAVFDSAAAGVPDTGAIVPFVESEPLPAVALTVNGKLGTFIVDTGAPDITLDPAFASEIGITPTQSSQGVFLGGRTAAVGQGVARSVGAGSIELKNVGVTILPSRGFGLYKDRVADGVVGTLFLARFLATIDYPHHRLVLRPRSTTLDVDPSATQVPMWLVGDHLIFASGSVNGVTGLLFSIDSGGAGVGFMPVDATIAAAHVTTFPAQAMQGTGGGGQATVIPTVAAEVCLGTVCEHNVPGGYTPGGSPLAGLPFHVAGTVSHVFLEHYAVTFDFVRMLIVLSRPPTQTATGIPLDTPWKVTIYDLARSKFHHPAWGWQHCERNYRIALELAQGDGLHVDTDVLFAAAFLHDMAAFMPCANPKLEHGECAAEQSGAILRAAGFPMANLPAVQAAERGHMYYSDPGTQPEAIVLHDADSLDFLGDIGAARMLSLTGASAESFARAIKTLRGFLREIPPRLITKTAQRMGARRAAELKQFLDALQTETFDGEAI